MNDPSNLVPLQVVGFAPVDLGNGTHADLIPGLNTVQVDIYSNNNFDNPLAQHTLSYEGYEQFRQSYPDSQLPKLEKPDPSEVGNSNPNSGSTYGKGAAPPVVRMVPNVVAARIYTSNEGPSSERPWYQRAADESARVLENTWEDIKQTAQTGWEALPLTTDETTTNAARERIKDGFMGTLEGVTTLLGPPPGMEWLGEILDDPEMIATAQAMRKQQAEAAQAILDSIKQSWDEAEERSGTSGAIAMVSTTILTELVGSKGTRAVTSGAQNAAKLSRKLPDTPPKGRDGIVVTQSHFRSNPGEFFENSYYSDKVKGQMKIGDYHSFPEEVLAHADKGHLEFITGRDGKVRQRLRIPGGYKGKEGFFEFIKESTGEINHRVFISN